MKRLAIILGILIVSCPADASRVVRARVGHIIDGDTFSGVVKLDGDVEISVRVRLRNVDTPEMNGECEYERNRAMAAKDRLAQLIPEGSIVKLKNIKDDKYLGRIDANVIDANGEDVGNRLVREGMGRQYNGGHRKKWCGK